ncbi:MAG: hypothetical protein JNN08_17210 [Bryobacterales bacterium]|nr:hypothetical protein [Bryobacterales bacterium]
MKALRKWLVVVAAMAGTGGYAGIGKGEDLRVVVIINNQAGYADAVVAGAMDVSGRVFRQAGVLVTWQEAAEGPVYDQGADLLINLARAAGTVMGIEGTGFAAAPVDGRPGYLIWVFRPAVDKVLDGRWLPVPRSALLPKLLGHVIAHEMGHLLGMNRKHASEGLMKANWHKAEIQLAYQGKLRFSEDECEKIRLAVRARNALPYRAIHEERR